MARRGSRRIEHTHSADCPCEPVLGILCECAAPLDRTVCDPGCETCHGLGVYRLPLGVAPRDSMVQIPICRDGNEGKYPIWTADPPGDDDE